jgi:hypothetical protein
MEARSSSADVVGTFDGLAEPVECHQMDVEAGGTHLLSQETRFFRAQRGDLDRLVGPLGPNTVGGRDECPYGVALDIGVKQGPEHTAEVRPIEYEGTVIHQAEPLKVDHWRPDSDHEITGHIRRRSHESSLQKLGTRLRPGPGDAIGERSRGDQALQDFGLGHERSTPLIPLKDSLSHQTADGRSNGSTADIEQLAEFALRWDRTARVQVGSERPHSIFELVMERCPVLA